MLVTDIVVQIYTVQIVDIAHERIGMSGMITMVSTAVRLAAGDSLASDCPVMVYAAIFLAAI